MTEEPYQPRLEVYRRRLQHSLGARFVLRFHVSLILAFTIAMGWFADWALLNAGMREMLLRYPLAVACAYVAFLAAVWIWIDYSGIREYLQARRADELVGEHVPQAQPVVGRGVEAGDLDWLDFASILDAEGCLVVLGALALIVGVFYFLGGYVWINAAAFFSEIVLELLLAAGLLRGIQKVEASGWVLGVWRSTRSSLLFSLIFAVLFSAGAHAFRPAAYTLHQVITGS